MSRYGEMLREAREDRGLSLAEAERGTKIRQRYLSAMEDDHLSALPSPVYTRGFLRNYALYLQLDADEVLDLYDEDSQPTRNRIRAARGETIPKVVPKQGKGSEGINIQPLSLEPIDTRVRYGSSYIAISLLALPLMIAFYFVYSVYAGSPSREVAIPTPIPAPPTITIGAGSVAGVPAGGGIGTGAYNTPTTYVPQAPGSPISATINTTGTIAALAGTPLAGKSAQPTVPPGTNIVAVVSVTTHDAWMQVLVDGVQKFNGTIPKGTTKQWTGKNTVHIRTGRADSVRVNINGQDEGLMGTADNLIVELQWDRTGAVTVIQR